MKTHRGSSRNRLRPW